jgi:hypothetical protein
LVLRRGICIIERMFKVEGFGDPTGMSSAELVDRLHDLEHQRRLLDAALVAVVGEAQRSGAFREDGHASVACWCRALTRWSDVEVVQRRRVADLAEASEPFTAALARGSIHAPTLNAASTPCAPSSTAPPHNTRTPRTACRS